MIARLLQSSTFYGNSPASMLVAAWLWLIAVLALVIIQRLLIRWLEKKAAVTARPRDHFLAAMLRKTRFVLILFIAMGLASVTLSLPPELRSVVGVIAKLALLVQIAIWGGELVAVLFRRYLSRAGAETSTTAEAISYVVRLVLWLLLILVGLESFGIHVTALVAGLGIGGIAIALAVQNILGDVFAALSILFDKPFVVGDLIEVGEYSGTVIHVGIKSTRMRSVTGEQIILANGELLKRGIRNFERTGQRRGVLITRISPTTPAKQARMVPEIIRRVIESQAGAVLDRSHLKTIADNSFEYETVYYLRAADYRSFLDTAQSINLALIRELRESGILLLSQKDWKRPPAPEESAAPADDQI